MDELVAKTLGKGRRVTLTFSQPLPNGQASGLTHGMKLSDDARSATCNIDDVAKDLPALLARFADGRSSPNVRVEDVQIDRPSLHAVFIALTGRELRE